MQSKSWFKPPPGALSDGAPLLCLFGPDAASDKTGVPGIRNELL